MKKILVLSVIFTLFSATVFAQPGKSVRDKEHFRKGFHTSELSRSEKMKLKKNDIRYKKAFRKFAKDGRISRAERKKLSAIKKHDRRKSFRHINSQRKRSI